MSAIHTDRFKNTFLNRIVFKYNNSFVNSVLSVFDFAPRLALRARFGLRPKCRVCLASIVL